MVVVRVLFPIKGLDIDEFNEKMLASVPNYEGLEGLIRKYYVVTDDKAKAGGIYLWESREKAEKFYGEEWTSRIAGLFGEPPMLEFLDCNIVIDNETNRVKSKVAA